MAYASVRTGDLHRFGRFLILDKLATGGMAEIFKVEDPERRGEVFALKRLRSDWDEDEQYRRMLLDEAELARRLDHRNIARVYEVVEEEDRIGLVMDLVEGLDLEQLQKFRYRQGDSVWPLDLAVLVVHEVLEGLDFAHDARDDTGRYLHLVHRDVSPGNIMVDAEGEIKIVDFGIAVADKRLAHTDAGHVKGKFRYMAPEQIKGLRAEPATDIYAAAVVLWELLSGVRVYDKDGLAQVMMKVAQGQVPSLRRSRPGLPEGIYRAYERATAPNPEERFPSAKAFQEALDGAMLEFDEAACRHRLRDILRWARTDESRLGLERALARAKDAADYLEGAILAALEAPDRVEAGPTKVIPALAPDAWVVADPEPERPDTPPQPAKDPLGFEHACPSEFTVTEVEDELA